MNPFTPKNRIYKKQMLPQHLLFMVNTVF